MTRSLTQRGPHGWRLWLAAGAIMLLAALIDSYGIASWPMADDEVPSLIEMGLRQQDLQTLSVPVSQVARLRATLPVWYGSQRWLIQHFGLGEVGYRIPSIVYAVFTIGLVFVAAARWRGWWFAAALAIIVNGSQLFVYLAQLDRFYSLALLLMAITFVTFWARPGGRFSEVRVTALCAILGVLSILSHNLSLIVWLLTLIASLMGWALGWVPRRLVWRSAATATSALLVYVFYVRELIAGWSSTGNPTPVLISYAAEASVPVVALALMGLWFSWRNRTDDAGPLWWGLFFIGSFCVYLLAWFNWNPRYFALFLPGTWVLAAFAVEWVGRALASRLNAIAWYAAVVLLLLPGLASHFQDGSRHDYREAARVVETIATPNEPILSDDAETISYYLPDDLRSAVEVRTKVVQFPARSFLLVVRSNAWMRQPQISNRQITLVDEIARRRFDEFSHVLRIYRVSPRS